MGRIRTEQVTERQLSVLRDINQKIFPILSVTEMSEDFYNNFIDEDTGFAFLAYYNDMLAGAVCCEMTDNNGLYIRFIGTLNRHRRKGVGKAMLGRVVKEAMDRDIHNVFTFVRADNKAGLHLNRKFGLLPKGPSNQNPSLVTVEKILHQDF
eukprot:TRINITY_DN6137_c0_g1_i2.p1 TRINITY_DN6137_c0_g1~~TRINITY_DN6137_c0_g1_i2.p1  ORF type:complete len:152 (-),score=39.99 TRINITY_DN6137_c0_g1_i2:255-710(-)